MKKIFLFSRTMLALLSLIIISGTTAVVAQNPDTFPVVSLCNLDLNRTATKLTASQLNNVNPAVVGYKWNTTDNETVRWRPQGIASYNAGCKQFSVVSWYGRDYNYPFPCDAQNADYRNRGSRVSFVDITDMDSIRYRHVLLVDENYNTFYDMHAGGLFIKNDTLYAPDSRGATDAMYAFPLNDIKEVPNVHLGDYYNYRYLLKMAPAATDSLPINPSFVSYDWDAQQMVVGSFRNCGPVNCATPSNNTLMWYQAGQVDRTSPFYDGLLGKMQGVGVATNLDNPNKKDVWVSTSYGYDNNSKLYAFSYDFGASTSQNQSITIDNNYAVYTLPPGIEDIDVSPTSDTIWTLTEFSPEHPTCSPRSSNQRYVFGFLRSDIAPPGACNGEIALTQSTLTDTSICTPSNLTFEASTNQVAYATFDASDNTWMQADSLADTLAASSRSVFMWIKKATTVSNESQVIFGMNTSTGGNICNLQISTAEKVGIYDGANSHYTTTTITDGQWHHIGYTYNEATNETKIYIDGVVEQTYTNSQTATPTTLYSLGQEFDSGLSKGNFLEGKLTEVSIWNEVLDATDVALLMSRTIQNNHPKRANLMAYYPMNNVCGDDLTVVKDISGNGFHAKAFGSIENDGVNVQSVEDLDPIPGFNSVDYFTPAWTLGGNTLSTTSTLALAANTYVSGNYELALTRNPFVITEAVNIDIQYTTATDVQVACGSFTWIDGNTYTASNNVATTTLTNAAGCDSIVTLDLTINNPSASVDVQVACGSFTWIDGNTYTASNNAATATLTNAAGCDSIVTLDLTINNPSASVDVQVACGSFTWIDGNTYTASNNVATATLTNAAGCDSIVTLDLTITTIDTTITAAGNSLVSNATNATSYQWMDCAGGILTPIPGATNATFNPSGNGDYAVMVTQGSCSSTSSCVNFTFTSTPSTFLEASTVAVYPNPTSESVQVSFQQIQKEVTVRLFSTTGQVMYEHYYPQKQQFNLPIQAPTGVYILEISSTKGNYTTKIIKR